uniref:Proline-rich protein 12 n=1 Tax=Dicentrarchus labrax TaxID=13489 RepID=E6ZH21_DICLA|nr:Proline-rich protein 12 [Dicentrarchus labrax]
MHTPAPPELFISGALPGSGSFPSSSALSAYQHPASFPSRSFPAASLSLQDTPTFSPTSNGLLSPHDPLLHIKAPSQSSLGFDRLLSSQGAAAAAYRGSQDPTSATSAQASSARHLQSHQFNLLSTQLQDQSSQLYNASVFSSAQPQPQSQSQSNSAQERAVPRQDSVIKHYQRPTPAQSQLSSSAAHSLQHYLSCGGAGYQQIATHHRHAGLSCSPLGDQSPSSDHKPASRTEQYRPIIQPPYSSSSSSSSSSSAGKGTKSSSSSGYSSASSASSSRTPHTPPSASSTSSSSSSSSATSGAHPSNSIPTSSSSAAPSRQQPPPQPAPPPPAPQQQPPATSTSAPQSLPKSCLSGYGSPVPPVKTPTSALTGQTPPQQQTQSYSPNQPPTSHLAQSYGGFSSPQAQDLSSGTGGKGYGSLGGRSQSYSTDIYGADSAYGSLPSSLGGAGSPSLGYGAPGHSPALLRSSGSSGSGASGGGSSSGTGNSSPSPSGNSGIIRPGLHSPVPTCPTQSPGGAGSNKYISSVLSPTFLASPQGYPDTRGPSSQPQSYHSTSSKTKADTSMLGVGSQRSQEEVDDDDEFLIQHLLQAQASPGPQAAHHHPQQQPQQTSQQTQPQPQSVPPTTDSGKGLSYDMGKTSEERYHPQSVIRTHSATSTAGVGNAGSGGSISGLENQLEMSLKKQQQQHQQQHHHQQQQQQRNERSVGSSRSSSVVHYGRGDPYTQHSLAPQHSSHSQHVSSHTQIPSHTQMELQKKPQERTEIPYPRKTPELQQQHSQSQAAASLMDSPTDQSRQPPHLLQSVLSHTTHIGLSTPSHMHHLSQHHPQQQQQQQHPSSQHQQTHSHHPHTQPHPHHIPPQSGSGHSQSQSDPQPLSSQLTPQQSQLDQQRSEQHQFDTVSPVEKADQNQQSNRFVPLTSICFPDSLLQDEDRSFFPGMEDMFCAEDYKSSCAGGAGPGQEEMNESHTGQEGMDSMKAGQSGGGAGGSGGASYDMMGHHGGDQGYEPYCHGLEEPSNNTMTLDLDSLKTHELPSTVNTEQLGLIQSQAPAMGMGSNPAGPNNPGAKMSSGPGGTSAGAGSGGLQSPIFCSSRPKKLLKSSSFHLLKERRDPNTLPKKSYAQEYEFEDDEDKADQPADIRLNSRRLPDLLPDLVSSCRKGGGGGSGSLSPLMGDLDFYHSSGYSSMGSHSLLPQDAPKKRGRKPTRPKREGPPRPRGRPRIRPMPEPYTPRGMMGEMGGTTVGGGFTVEGRGRGRGRGSRDGSVGSAPSLGLSPGPPCSADSTRSQDKNKQKSQMMSEGVDEEGLEDRGDEKDSESKAGFVASFLDFLKTGKRPPGLDISPGMEPDNGENSPCKSGGLRPLSPAPPPPPPPPPFGDSEGNGGLALGNCSSPKRLEDELKRNLETLPSFSSDEEDSVGKNQDLQKSISSAISALYDTPQLTSNIQPQLSPPPPQHQPQPTQSPLTPTLQPPTLSPQPTMHTPHAMPQLRYYSPLPEIPPAPETPEPPSVPPSPASSSSSPSHSPLPPLSLPSPLPPPEEQLENSQPPSPVAPTAPSSPPPPPATLPQPATPPPTSPPPPSSSQKESPMPSPESPVSPEEPPPPKITSLHLAQKQEDAAIAGESEDDESESGGEGIFRERDEFVVRVEDIRTLKLALQMGREPPPIWRVQKALLQKFSPEIKDGQRQFCATSNYLGYFGDAKRRYQRIYVKFLENVNKKDYVRVCSRRPWRRATPALRRQSLPKMASPPATQAPPRVVEKEERVAPPVQREQREKTRTATATTKEQREKKETPDAVLKAKEKEKERDSEKEREKEKRVQLQQDKVEKRAAAAERGRAKEEKKALERKEKEKAERPPKSKPAKVKAEPPPKKRKKWLKEIPSSSDSDSSEEAASENEMPVKGGVNNRAMREMFRSYVEMLVSTALDPDMIQALEDTDDELYLPPMRKIDSILSEQKRRLLRRVSMSSQHQEVLHAYPQIIVDPLDSGVVRVRLSGDAYNRKTLNRVKKTLPKPQDLKLSADSYRIYSLYHSLHHYKYHTFLQCKKETNTIEQAAEDPGQEEVVQQCMANQSWLDTLFSSFIELLTLSTKA